MRIRIVDAFTDRPFAGNPAGVVLLDSDAFPDETWLQEVAAEVNLAETAFAHRIPGAPDNEWALRWFTPVAEVDLCGHATLATAHVLSTTGRVSGAVRFSTRSGVLIAEAAADGVIGMDFPAAPLTAVETPDDVGPALGAPVVAVYSTGESVGDLLVVVTDEQTVRALTPDLGAVARVKSRRGLIVTAPADTPDSGYDFVSRCFFPNLGIPEDPVTGSAHTALAPYWSDRLGRRELTGLQASARSGLVRTALRGDRVVLSGSAVTVIDGELHALP
jgi:PhzF family phenazine biosynthesis protein